MTEQKVWFITGAARGMGLEFAKAALAAGDLLVASGRDTDRLSKALGSSSNLLTVKLDVTRPADADAAVKATVDRFGRLDVMINCAVTVRLLREPRQSNALQLETVSSVR